MKIHPLLVLLISYPLLSQTDTIYFDAISGNYIVRYTGVTIDDTDTLITFTYEPSTKIDPIIQSYVIKTTEGNFLYRYRITNGSNAKQNLVEFSLHYDSSILIESRTPETSWRNRGRKIRDYSDINNPKLVLSWVWRGDQGLESTWSIDSCIISSNGLPSITNSYTRAVHHTLVWPADQKDNSWIDINSELGRLEVYPINNVLRKTIGPKLVPGQFDKIIFLDTLLSYTRQSVQLGWLKSTRDDDCDDDEQPNDGVSKNIEKRIEKAKKELMKGDSVKARKELEKLVKKVGKIYKKSEEGEKKKKESEITMTSEAYALLKYNTEYLIERLPEKGRK